MSENHMPVNESPEVRSLETLIGGSFPETLSKISSNSLRIPANEDFHFFYNFDEFKRPIDELAGSLQCILETIGGSAHVCGKPMTFAGEIDGDDAYDWLVNTNNKILEKFDASVEEYKENLKKEAETGQDSESGKKKEIATSKIDVKEKVSFHVPTIKKPQREYSISVNNANTPFEHVWLERSEDGLQFIHPLEKLSVMDFVDQNITEMKPVKPLPLEQTPFKLVEEVKDLEDLAAKLHSVEEFAVDLEHNQYRSFQGLTCLMQISTRTEDYVIDTFKLWDYIGPLLREVFKDSKKKKVMHGADRDIIWLQRDFGIYVCNLFDTGKASRVLKLERYSLEFLLKHYCGVAANKQYQNADWRIRPLPDVMKRYAREDTHYLLYIYDLMRIDLHTIAKEDEQSDSPLVEVYKRSYDVCMQLYEKELLTGDSYLHLYGVQAANFNPVQLSIVSGLFEWRDRIARAEDESTGYVLPNKTLLDIAKEMPFNVGKLRRLLKSKLPYVERNMDAVVSVIRRSMQNSAAFLSVVKSLEERRPKTVSEKNTETTIEETGTEAVASSSSLNNSTTGLFLFGSEKVSVDVSKKPSSSGLGTLLSKRKFESDNKAKEEQQSKEEVKVSKSKPNEAIIVSDDDEDEFGEEETSETNDASDRVVETPEGSTQEPKTCGPDIVMLDSDDSSDDDDSDNDSKPKDEKMSWRSEKTRFMSMKR